MKQCDFMESKHKYQSHETLGHIQDLSPCYIVRDYCDQAHNNEIYATLRGEE
jgi:hypothetical protein